MPNVFDAIAVDLTDYTSPYGSVHIRDKTSVGERLAAAGMATVYKQASTYWQGPTATSAVASDFASEAGVGSFSSPSPMSSIVITFGNTGAAGLSVNRTAGACSKGVCQAPFEVCTLIAAAHSSSAVGNNCSVVQTASGGRWKLDICRNFWVNRRHCYPRTLRRRGCGCRDCWWQDGGAVCLGSRSI